MNPGDLLVGEWREIEGVCVFGEARHQRLRTLLHQGKGWLRRALGRTRAASFDEGLRLWKRPGEVAYFRDREKNESYRRAVELAGRYVKGRALDVGCGTGHLLKNLGSEATGIDSSFASVYLARRFVAPEALLVCADVSRGLPFRDGAMDAVVSIEAFTYVADREALAREMRRVWNGRSALVLSHLHRASPPPAHPVSREELERWFPGARVEEETPETFRVIQESRG